MLILNLFDYLLNIVNIMFQNLRLDIRPNTLIIPSNLESLDLLCNFQSIEKTLAPVEESTLMWIEDFRSNLMRSENDT